MAWWTPLMARICGPGRRSQSICFDFRCFVLDKLQIITSAKLSVLGQGGKSVSRGRERVHEHELEIWHRVLLLHKFHLLGNKIQERVAVGDRQQRLCLLKTHASSKTSIQLQDYCLLQQLRPGRDGQGFEIWQGGNRIQNCFGDHCACAGCQDLEVVLECVDGRIALALLSTCLHLGLIGWPQSLEAHIFLAGCSFRPHAL
mmetsp:Transcript_33400/g.61279  ORF Transcript_33400/g.61279 Transcript_33400/m.61279 type:complete len:201 (+) Transcript_33400:988-1590(+)